ncbi:MAG TPA: LysM peptidoglycan-binding domain-containing protein [Casimicrobiaceae bacterium]|nr:LysM peptidoglycan-binding domain-containing protein [Casimicrobiaceae bacterium]
MRQKFSTALTTISVVAALAAGVGVPASAQDAVVSPNAPQSYTVQRGDTLWGISGKFLREPWRWPEVWRMNRDEIRNPHRIYPGDVVRLDYADGRPRLSIAQRGAVGASGQRETLRISPTPRSTLLDREAIPTIPPGDIEPFLSRPLVTGPDGLKDSAEIVAGRDRDRVVRGEGDRVYVVGIDPKAGGLWHVYRSVGPIRSHNLREQLGFEYKYLGAARVERYADVSTLLIENATEEIQIGDRLVPAPREVIVNYAPHAPTRDVEGRIISTVTDTAEMGRGSIVTIDKGAQDGIDVGTVLAVYRGVSPIPDPRPNNDTPVIVRFFEQTTFYRKDKFLDVPQERTGLMIVFRTFDRVAYAILLNTTDPIQIGDFVRKP